MPRKGGADREDGVHDIVSKGIEATSKFLSYVLRHKPETIGLELDPEGWAMVVQLGSLASKLIAS